MREPLRSRRSAKPRYYVTLARGERIHCLSVRPWIAHLAAASVPVLVALGVGGVAALSWRGDASFQTMRAQQEELKAAYDDRLVALREQMDIAARAGAQDRSALEAQMRALATRQAALDNSTEMISRIAEAAAQTPQTSIPESPGDSSVAAPALDAIGALAPLTNAQAPAALPDAVQAFAPASAPLKGRSAPLKPHPDGMELRSDHDKTSWLGPSATTVSMAARLASLSADASRIQGAQVASITRLASSVARSAEKVRVAIAETGLSLDRLSTPRPLQEQAEEPMGGPYIPVRLDVEGSPLENEFDKLQNVIAQNEAIAAALPYLPLRQPLSGTLVMTSPFGVRLDPFLGRLGFHPGEDLRAYVGEPVMATAAGKVIAANYDGGYGNMVLIDHGDGLSTRYAHLSAILVGVGQVVAAGAVIGRAGTTGRSTGPHLHYEVRVNGQPVNPAPFVRAGETLWASR